VPSIAGEFGSREKNPKSLGGAKMNEKKLFEILTVVFDKMSTKELVELIARLTVLEKFTLNLLLNDIE
jgi:ribosomal protein L4